jgi:hypothetical protein
MFIIYMAVFKIGKRFGPYGKKLLCHIINISMDQSMDHQYVFAFQVQILRANHMQGVHFK